MNTEDYVSFDTAKLLKEKGFDVYVRSFYDADDMPAKHNEALWDWNLNKENYRFSAPTLQMAMKWLRKFHKLCVVVKPYITEEGIFYLFEIKEMNKDSVVNQKSKTGFDTYEEACEAAIKYCLENLI